ncbi:MAG: hypothetical protein J2P54_18695 [Bradyrhizobiaceae bacterium]|nr:hypothetical protein [Bradyrhizobiaceae bacterium]
MTTIDDLIAAVIVEAPAKYRALSVFPLRWETKRQAAVYLVLNEALATGKFRITEVSESGAVPRLLALNLSDSHIFLLDGEELVGAKQNRVLNLSMMLAPNSRTEIPVSCVEAGRWRRESHAFGTADRVHFARGRAQKMEQVSRSLHLSGEAASDQTAVWNAISAKSARMRVASPTGAMAALFESRRDDLQDYLDAIPTVEGQCGAVYALGGVVVAMEIFDSDTTFKKLARKLVASYALDAMELDQTGDLPDADAARSFIHSVRVASRERSGAVGVGKTVRISGGDLVGAALELDGRCVHLSAFGRSAFADQDGDNGLRDAGMRRRYTRVRGRMI